MQRTTYIGENTRSESKGPTVQRITLVERLIQLQAALDSADLDELQELREYVHRAQNNAIGRFEDWSPAEREVVEATIERICSEVWKSQHSYDSLRAGRDWKAIQKWLKKNKQPGGGSIGARVYNNYAREVERHRAMIAYYVEWGFIEGAAFTQSAI